VSQTRRDLVVVGASAGGVEALRVLVAGLPEDLSAAVVVVLHIPASGPSVLPSILQRAGQLPVRHVADRDQLLPGHVYVAPPDRHVVVVDGGLALSAGPRENGHRPAVDVLFRSAAWSHGPRAIGVVLSGGLDDGTSGLAAIQRLGGVGLVQDPNDALHPGMPRNAIDGARPRFVAPVVELPPLIEMLLNEDIGELAPTLEPDWETQLSLLRDDPRPLDERPGVSSGISCPDCHGVLFQIDDEPPRFRCRVGHAWSIESLVAEEALAVDNSLWTALRSLEEQATIAAREAERAAESGRVDVAKRYERKHHESHAASGVIRRLLAEIASASDTPQDIGPEAPAS
jgi:two-component system chemotaxis response regulator CheB